MNMKQLEEKAQQIRLRDLQAVFDAGAGHIGGELSVIDLLTALYFNILSIDSSNPKDPERDRLILSKGHTALALYIVLSERGFIPKEEIQTFLLHNSRLNGHPNCVKVPGVETNTGPLGHGLPFGVGTAIAAKLNKENWRTFVIVGDGEMQEGSNWEAIMSASHFRLDNLTLIIDHNGLQQGASLVDTNNIVPFVEKIKAFGWSVEEIDGHDMLSICNALSFRTITQGKPKCIVAHTHKGRGISFMTDNVVWHHKVPSEEQFRKGISELRRTSP